MRARFSCKFLGCSARECDFYQNFRKIIEKIIRPINFIIYLKLYARIIVFKSLYHIVFSNIVFEIFSEIFNFYSLRKKFLGEEYFQTRFI